MVLKKSSTEFVRRALTPFFPRLWRYCLLLTKNRPEADDLAQAACLKALEKAHQFETGTHFDRWVIRIAHTQWINERRKLKVRTGDGLVPVEETDLADTRSDQETNIFAAEVLSEVMALPDGQRHAVALVYVEGFSYKEAADAMNVPVGTVMSRLSAARAKLADRIRWQEDSA